MRKFGTEDKPRFSIKWEDGTIESFGTCNPKDVDRSYIGVINGKYYLLKIGKEFIPTPVELTEGVRLCNGYYESERGEWVTAEQFCNEIQ